MAECDLPFVFSALPTHTDSAGSRPLRICIASCEFIGPIRNGGIGTAYTAMARALAAAGHQVTLFYTQGQHCENETAAHWKSHYEKQGVKFVARPSNPNLRIDGPDRVVRSYETYQWLKGQQFDVVHFPEWSGDGYYSILAKHQGIAFQKTLFCIGTHSPNAWLKQANSEYYAHPLDLEVDFMERQCVAFADVVVSPCQYMLRWMTENGFKLPARSYVQQNILPISARGDNNSNASNAPQQVNEIVFFGRLETRKGIELFCDALDRLVSDASLKKARVTFMGKVATVNQIESRTYIQKRAAKWPWQWDIVSNLDQPGAMKYLKQPGRLAVIPSLMENSPYTVLECLGGGIPFLASRVGGIPELIAEEDVAHATFIPSPADLSTLLAKTLQTGVRPWKPSMEATANEKAWVAWHASLKAETAEGAAPVKKELPLVTVCVAHFNRPHFLQQALSSLEAQDYPNLEVIIVDDGSTKPEAIQYLAEIEPKLQQRNWRIVRQQNKYLSAARNTGARHARGEYLMFMDDDNFARPEEVSTFIRVALNTGADVITGCMEYFEGTGAPQLKGKAVTRWVPLGPALSAGYFRNVFGDANCMVKKTVFEQIGGFTEIHGVTHEDWEFLAKAVLKGHHLEMIPESLFYYRYTPDSMIRSTSRYKNHLRHIRPFLSVVPPEMHQILLMAQGAWIAESSGKGAGEIVAKLSLKWRSQFEAGKILNGLGHQKPAREQFLAALNSAAATEHHLVILEAMLEISNELQKIDSPRAKEILQLAIQLGNKTFCHEAVRQAEALLRKISGNGKTSSPAMFNAMPAPVIPQPTSSAQPLVSIVIPVFNRIDLTRDCLASIQTNTAGNYEIVVVNNASTDGTTEFLREKEKSGVIRHIQNESNLGFSRACNQGAQAAKGSLVLFLNNDTQVTKGWLEAMIQAAERPQVGIVGAKLLYADNRIQHAGIGFINGVPDHPHRFASADAAEVNAFRELDMVTGACLMIHRDLFLQAGGFDEIFRNGVEDVDLCLRVRAANRKVVYEPKAVVYHLEGQSAGRFNHVKENLEIFFQRWGKSFDAKTNFIVPKPAKVIAAKQSLFTESAALTNVQWLGSFLDAGSLSHVNRELTGALIHTGKVALTRVNTGAEISPAFKNFSTQLSKTATCEAAVTVRHAWPPDWSRPKNGKLVVVQPWEFGSLPEQWVKNLASVDEVWIPSEYVRRVYVDSGVPAGKVHVVPNGVDTETFNPQAAPMALATKKKFKFLFVGGTIFRKGPDVLLNAYLNAFTAADDVCLVIKDFGGKTVYAGQTFEAKIRAAQAAPNAPEILYLNEEMSPESLPGLYTACDCFVLPYRGEGYGLPAVEAMACGLPVMVTAGGATDDFVRDEFGFRIPSKQQIFGNEISGMKLVNPGWLLEPNASVLADRMKWIAAHPDEARQRGALASEHAKQFCSWKHAAEIALKRVEALVNTRTEVRAPERKIESKRAQIVLPPAALMGHLAQANELVRQKKFRAAWETALAAIAKRPFHPEAYLLFAEIALAVGDGQDAKLCAEHARRIAPEFKNAKKFLNQRLNGSNRPEWLKLPEQIASPQSTVHGRLSVCLIVKNEEKFLAQCLKSVQGLAQQIIVVDTGSTDRTVEIAKEHGAEVHSFTWCDDFSAARNAALEHVTGDWVLALDADEELSAKDHEKLRTLMNDASVMAWRLPIIDVGRELDGCSYVPRLFRNAPGLFYLGRVHEQIFSSIEVRRAEWGLENKIGDAALIHHGYVAEVVRDRNKIERNLLLLEKAVEELPGEPHLLMHLGMELSRSGREADSFARYQEAFESMSSKPAAEIVPELRETLLTQYCTRLVAVKRFDEVVRVLTSPLATGMGNGNTGLTASLHFSLGLAHLELKQFGEAADQMRQCLAKRTQRSLSPINRDIMTAAPHHCLALALAKAGNVEEAEKAFQAALKEPVNTAGLRLDYAKLLTEQKRPVDALQQLNEIVTHDVRNIAAWRFGGQVALSQPDFLEFAGDWTGEAMRHVPEDPIVVAQRAEALMLSENIAGARDLWEKVWNNERKSQALAALILCGAASGNIAHKPEDNKEEIATSRAFIEWYRKLFAVRAQKTLTQLMGNMSALNEVLPSAAKILGAAMAEANKETVGA